MILTTPVFKLFRYGVPQIGQFYKQDKDRTFLKIPISDSDEDKLFTETLCKFDTYVKAYIYNKITQVNKSFHFTSSVRTPMDKNEDGDESDNGQNKTNPKYCKFKFISDFNSGVIKTKVYHGPQKTLLDINPVTMTNIENCIKFKSSIKMNIQVDKLWISKSFSNYRCGLTYKIVQLLVIPEPLPILKSLLDSDKFVDFNNNSETDTFLSQDASVPNFEIDLNDFSDSESDNDYTEE